MLGTLDGFESKSCRPKPVLAASDCPSFHSIINGTPRYDGALEIIACVLMFLPDFSMRQLLSHSRSLVVLVRR